jgi:hypothetical protein
MPIYVQGTEFKPDRINLPTSSSNPGGSHETGDIYFNTTDNKPMIYHGGNWTPLYGEVGGGGNDGSTAAKAVKHSSELVNAGVSTDGWYYFKTAKMASAKKVYCNFSDRTYSALGAASMGTHNSSTTGKEDPWMLVSYCPSINHTDGNHTDAPSSKFVMGYPSSWSRGEGTFDNFTVNLMDLWFDAVGNSFTSSTVQCNQRLTLHNNSNGSSNGGTQHSNWWTGSNGTAPHLSNSSVGSIMKYENPERMRIMCGYLPNDENCQNPSGGQITIANQNASSWEGNGGRSSAPFKHFSSTKSNPQSLWVPVKGWTDSSMQQNYSGTDCDNRWVYSSSGYWITCYSWQERTSTDSSNANGIGDWSNMQDCDNYGVKTNCSITTSSQDGSCSDGYAIYVR